ncbi:MAG: hypothetical protein ACNS60_01715 [Candidatus Cyclobacteriaceae bacterium M2_1C_046]
MIKYTKHFLARLEDLIAETDYMLRYEKGNFKSGYCILNETKIIIINKYYAVDGKINCLLEIIKTLDLGGAKFSEKNRKLYQELSQISLEL